MAEAKPVIAGEKRLIGLDELLTRQRDQAPTDASPRVFVEQLGHRAAVEAPALNRSPLDYGTVRRIQPIDARGQESLNGGRDQNGSVARRGVCVEREQLFNEERVALGCFRDPRAGFLREVLCHQLFDQSASLASRDWLEGNEHGIPPRDRPRRS